MRKPLSVIAAILSAIVPIANCYAQGNLADTIERCEKSVVRIAVKGNDGSRSEGSGFVVAPHTIATNVHVLMGAKEAEATFPNEKRYRIVGTYRIDVARDIAIARIEGEGVEQLPILPLSTGTARKGETVVALGSPLGLAFTATSGVVSALRDGAEISRELGSESVNGEQHKGSWVQLDAALSPGNSGGPIVNSAGQVVAMSTLASQGAQNLNFGISCQDISKILATVSDDVPLTSLSKGVGEITSKRSRRGGGGSGSSGGAVEPKDIPTEAIEAYVAIGKSEFKTLKRDLLKEIERLRSTLKEVRNGESFIPPNIQTEKDIVRVPGKRNTNAWYFRTDSIKRAIVASLDTQMKDLNKISTSTADAADKNALLTLLSKYGPEVDMRLVGSVGFLPSATVLHAFNGHEALVLINEVPCIMLMESTAGLASGEEIIPTPVFVAGTATARMTDGKTAAVTVVQAVTQAELRKVIFAGATPSTSAPNTASPSTAASSNGPAGAPTNGARMWYDKTGSFSVEAVLLQVNDKEVLLRRTDGKTIKVPRANLSEADQRYLRQ